MTEMDKISEAVLKKVHVEAEGIIADARAKADDAVAKARKQRDARLDRERSRLLEEARVEASRIAAQAAIAARGELAKAKAAVVDEVFSAARAALAGPPGAPEDLRALIEEGIATLGRDKVRLIVSPRDAAAARALIGADRNLGERVAEVKEAAMDGGTIVEDLTGTVRVDNSYETRLAMARPAMLVEIGNGLLKS